MSVVDVNGVKIYYEIHEKPELKDNSEPVLLLNGIMMSTASWAKQLPSLSKSWKVVLHDFRGQGRSTLVGSQITFDDHAEDLRLLLDHLQLKKVHLVGTSYGSEVGMYFTLKYPDRVASLTIAAGVSESDALLKEKIRSWQRLAIMATRYQTKEEFFLGTISANFSANYLEKHASILAERGKSMTAISDEWFMAFNALCECFLTLNITEKLKKIRVPTLIVAGLQDELKPLSYSKILAKEIPDSKLECIDAGHALILEKADEFNEMVLKFLRIFKNGNIT